MTEPGHNSVDPEKLRNYVRNIEDIQVQIDAANEAKSEVYKTAKEAGVNVPALKVVISERARHRKDPNKAEEQADAVETYRAAIGAA